MPKKCEFKSGTNPVPVDARQFIGEMSFAEITGKPGELQEAKVSINARSAKPIDHWYWGRIIHDMDGMKPRNSRVQLDWRHRHGIAIGFAENIKADKSSGVTCDGRLQSIREDDQANEVMQRGNAGHPYEASIDWNGEAVLEYVHEGHQSTVNGTTFEGPGYIVREWELRSIAVTPFGADANTETKFSDEENPDDPPRQSFVTVITSKKEFEMADTTTKPADESPEKEHSDQPKPETKPEQTKGRSAFDDELSKFTKAFGADNGVKWFQDSTKTFEDALVEQCKVLTGELAKKDEQIKKLEDKIKSLNTGEEQGSEFDHDDQSSGQSSTPKRANRWQKFQAAIDRQRKKSEQN